jgi:hypothetical protein
MNRWHERAPWLLPVIGSVLTGVLGVLINLATDLKTSWIAWAVVALLIVCVAWVTARSQTLRPAGPVAQSTSVTEETVEKEHVSRLEGIQMRRVKTVKKTDGEYTVVTEIFTKELALLSLREESIEDEG